MHRRGSPGAMENRITKCKIDVHGRVKEAGKREQDSSDARLQLPPTPVIAGATQRPDQQRRQDDVVEREQAHPEREMLIPHILGAPKQVTAQELRPGDRKSTRLNSSHSQISYAV